MKCIESKEDMLKWAQEVNYGVTLNRKVELQDVWAHSQVGNIDKFFIELEGERRLIICSVNNCMAFEEVERLLGVLAHHKVSKQMQVEYAELDARLDAVAKREHRINELETECKKSEERIIQLESDLFQARKSEREYKLNSDRFDKIKELLAL